jgi:uncharacterized protein YegL
MSEGYGLDRGAATEGQIVMPFYLICDVSYSMIGDMPALNDSLQRLKSAIVAKPIVDDVARIGIMTFSDTAKVVMPLGIMHQQTVPTLSVEGGTNYGAAFRELAHVIPADAAELKRQGCRIYRPCAFFLTDGEPLDDTWHQTFKDTLTYDRNTKVGMKMHPVFVPFGFRQAPEDVLRQLAYPIEKGKWYHTKSHNVEQALNEIMSIIMKTVVSSGLSASTSPTLVHPTVNTAATGISQGAAEEFIDEDEI